MTDHIKREEAMEIVKRTSGDYASAFAELRKLPAADVAPVRRGCWRSVHASEATGWDPKIAGSDPIWGYMCTNCWNEAIFDCNDEYILSDYCPNCGARMNERKIESKENETEELG